MLHTGRESDLKREERPSLQVFKFVSELVVYVAIVGIFYQFTMVARWFGALIICDIFLDDHHV